MGHHRGTSACPEYLQTVSAALSLICLAASYLTVYADKAREATDFFDANRETIATGLAPLAPADRDVALAVVAPEASCYSAVCDFVELRTLFVMYVNTGVSDFSVGHFQMKPSFVEDLERRVSCSAELRKVYGDILPRGDSERARRRWRLEKLSTLEGELRYLCVFMTIAKSKTAGRKFSSETDRVRYIATLYNAGLGQSPDGVRQHLKERRFPKYLKTHNYGDVAAEFYLLLSKRRR